MKTTISQYDQQALDFCTRYGIKVSIVRADPHGPGCTPAWEGPHGNQYKVTLSAKHREPVTFDFWGSLNDQQKGEDPSAYDVLACVSGDVNCPETFEYFCAEYGYDEDSRKAFATFERCHDFARKLRDFFPEGEERDALCEIQ